MKFEKKAVIFDLDGVICFTDRFHYYSILNRYEFLHSSD